MRYKAMLGAGALALIMSVSLVVYATTPSSHDVTVPTTAGQVVTVTWTGSVGPGAAGGGNTCPGGLPAGTDEHTINLTVPAGTYNNLNIDAVFHIEWDGGSGSDLVLSVEQDGTNIGDSDGGEPQENVGVSNPPQAKYVAIACPFTATAATPFKGKLTLTASAKASSIPDADKDGVADADDNCPGTPRRTPVDAHGCPYPMPAAGTPRFFTYASPSGIADDSGEPSIGCNQQTEKVFTNTNVDETTNSIPNGGTSLYYGGFSTYMSKITFDDCASPANFTWDTKPLIAAATPRVAGDPILFTDKDIGRTWAIQLEPGAGATIDITDDDGDNFTPSDGIPDQAYDFDHETLASGPYHAPLTGGVVPGFPYAVYYAAQGISDARMWRSDNGGLVFGAGAVMWTIKDCDGLHGHVKVAPNDGTVYVPDKACQNNGVPFVNGGHASVIVSEDNGLTFSIRPVPQDAAATSGNDDPSVGVSKNGVIYLGWQSSDGHPRISVSKDKGLTWSTPFDVGANVINGRPVVNCAFPEVVAGDDDRAAFAFFGSETAGAGADRNFPGVYYMYIATTFDGGKTWTTQNATPGDPIQRGGITGADPGRNLLDFFDMTIDKQGRILVGGEDGCITDHCIDSLNPGPTDNDDAAKAFITRQTGGKRMFAAFDPVEPARPGAPKLSGGVNVDQDTANLSWGLPDNGASAITGYKVYKRIGTSGPFTLIGSPTTNAFDDTAYDKTQDNYYHVTALNAIGEGPYCKNFHPTLVIPPDPCKLPGVHVVDDASGDATPAADDFDIQFVAGAEIAAFPNDIVFTYKVKNFTAGLPPPNSFYVILFPTLPNNFYIAVDSTQGPARFVYGNATPDPAGQGLFIFNPANQTALDAASGALADGTMTLYVPRAALGNPAPGTVFSGLDVRARAGGSSVTSRDTAGPGAYTVSGPIACAFNNAPVAKLLATPDSGQAPLTVTFDASQSHDPDASDTIAQYKIRFGVGDEGYSGASPMVDATYEQPGTYVATLSVVDSRGLKSTEVARKTIVVTGAPGKAEPGNNKLGGALSLGSGLLLGALGLRRRFRKG